MLLLACELRLNVNAGATLEFLTFSAEALWEGFLVINDNSLVMWQTLICLIGQLQTRSCETNCCNLCKVAVWNSVRYQNQFNTSNVHRYIKATRLQVFFLYSSSITAHSFFFHLVLHFSSLAHTHTHTNRAVKMVAFAIFAGSVIIFFLLVKKVVPWTWFFEQWSCTCRWYVDSNSPP